MNNRPDEPPAESDWLEPAIELPSHAAMGTDTAVVAERIARTAIEHANRSRLAFDASGLLVDWQDIGDDTWARGSTPNQRVHEFAGGANHAIIERTLRSHHSTTQ